MEIEADFTNPKVGIVGGTRGMGAWFGDLLERNGLTVYRVGRKTALTPEEMASQCDVVVISVPIAATDRVIEEVGPLVPVHGLMMDLTSVKKEPVKAMLEHSRAHVAGVHPLFGPEADCTCTRRIAVCPGRGEAWQSWLIRLFETAGLTVTVLSPERHDRMMGLVQGVNHFSTLALALCIGRSGFVLEDIAACSTQTFRHRLDRISAILNQQPELFWSLMGETREALEGMKLFLDGAGDLFEMVSRHEEDAFERMFDELGTLFQQPDVGDSMSLIAKKDMGEDQ